MSDPAVPQVPQGAPQPNQQPSQQIPQTKVGGSTKDVINILTALTGLAYMGLYWSSEDGKFFVNNKGSWVEYRQFRPMKLTPEMLGHVKNSASCVPGSNLFYMTPENVKSLYLKALS